MFIIFGTRARFSSVDEGEFYCPRCRGVQPYERKKAKLWVTLYFLPVFPVKTLGEVVECGGCGENYKPEVLNVKVRELRDDPELRYNEALLKVMTRVMTVGPDSGPEQAGEIRRIFSKVTRHEVSPEMVMAFAGESWATWDRTKKALGDMSAQFTQDEKERIIKAAVMTARADGAIDPAEESVMRQAADALGLSSDQQAALIP